VKYKIDLRHKLRSGASIEQADKLIFSCIKMLLYKLQIKRVAIHIMVLRCKDTDAIHALSCFYRISYADRKIAVYN